MKSRLFLGNACYHSVQNSLSSHLLSKILKINIHKITMLLVLEQSVDENIWTSETESNRRLEETAKQEAS
jgi:hypothetical protein